MAFLPQTAKIDRKSATCTVTYDGEPSFSPISGTHMMVAENSSVTVLKSNGWYYAVENGVWFESNNPEGPWQVATQRPNEVDNIPADNMAYNSRYVYVYDYNPDYVWMGYTPGYLGSYVYGPTVVWGTGWNYRPWYRHRYFPRAYTWGFGMQYNPWGGWGIGYNSWWGFGDYYWDNSFYFGGFGWFGPSYYRPRYSAWGFNGGLYGRGVGFGIRTPNVIRPVTPNGGLLPRAAVGGVASNNLYHRVAGARTTDVSPLPRTSAASVQPRTAPTAPAGAMGRPSSGLNSNRATSGNTQQQHINRQGNSYSNHAATNNGSQPSGRQANPQQSSGGNNNYRSNRLQQSQQHYQSRTPRYSGGNSNGGGSHSESGSGSGSNSGRGGGSGSRRGG